MPKIGSAFLPGTGMPDYEELMMKHLLVLALITTFNFAFADIDDLVIGNFAFDLMDGAQFPIHPNEDLTPGHACDYPTTYRYPEHIPYCERNVDNTTKAKIIQTYDAQLGFQVGKMNRQDFKIDHYLPLCMGGANSSDNLWPQHKSIYPTTDIIEDKICQLMAKGKMLQREAFAHIRRVKNNLDEAPTLLKDLNAKLK